MSIILQWGVRGPNPSSWVTWFFLWWIFSWNKHFRLKARSDFPYPWHKCPEPAIPLINVGCSLEARGDLPYPCHTCAKPAIPLINVGHSLEVGSNFSYDRHKWIKYVHSLITVNYSSDRGDDSRIFSITPSVLDSNYTGTINTSPPHCKIRSCVGPSRSYPLEGLSLGPPMGLRQVHPSWIQTQQ